jgi:hypothetical protein
MEFPDFTSKVFEIILSGRLPLLCNSSEMACFIKEKMPLGAMAPIALADDPAGGDVEGGKR